MNEYFVDGFEKTAKMSFTAKVKKFFSAPGRRKRLLNETLDDMYKHTDKADKYRKQMRNAKGADDFIEMQRTGKGTFGKSKAEYHQGMADKRDRMASKLRKDIHNQNVRIGVGAGAGATALGGGLYYKSKKNNKRGRK